MTKNHIISGYNLILRSTNAHKLRHLVVKSSRHKTCHNTLSGGQVAVDTRYVWYPGLQKKSIAETRASHKKTQKKDGLRQWWGCTCHHIILSFHNMLYFKLSWFPHLEAGEVRDPRAADQVGDGLARVLDGPHELFEVLCVCVFCCCRWRFCVGVIWSVGPSGRVWTTDIYAARARARPQQKNYHDNSKGEGGGETGESMIARTGLHIKTSHMKYTRRSAERVNIFILEQKNFQFLFSTHDTTHSRRIVPHQMITCIHKQGERQRRKQDVLRNRFPINAYHTAVPI